MRSLFAFGFQIAYGPPALPPHRVVDRRWSVFKRWPTPVHRLEMPGLEATQVYVTQWRSLQRFASTQSFIAFIADRIGLPSRPTWLVADGGSIVALKTKLRRANLDPVPPQRVGGRRPKQVYPTNISRWKTASQERITRTL